jgi:hypothetical protein
LATCKTRRRRRRLWRADNFPLWLAPDQVRVEADFSATPFKAKAADAER